MDISLYCREEGEGFPLILLHGNGEDHTYFAAQQTFFAPHFHTLAIDTRGHGRSPRGEGDFSISRFADDLHDFMLSRSMEKAHILGFSDGANIAMVFALRYPHMVKRLVLNGGNLTGSGVKLSVQLPIILGYAIASLCGRWSAEAKRHAELLGLMVKDPALSPAALSAITAPTLVIAGTRDMIKTSHTRAIAAAIPEAKLALLPGDHFLAAKEPDAFNRAVWEFLSAP